MLILRVGLYVSIGMAILATWMSTSAGYAIEVAMVRGLLAFMAGSLVAYIAELVVMTAPPPADADGEYAHGTHEAGDEHDDDGQMEPVSLPAIRTERDAALDDSRAA